MSLNKWEKHIFFLFHLPWRWHFPFQDITEEKAGPTAKLRLEYSPRYFKPNFFLQSLPSTVCCLQRVSPINQTRYLFLWLFFSLLPSSVPPFHSDFLIAIRILAIQARSWSTGKQVPSLLLHASNLRAAVEMSQSIFGSDGPQGLCYRCCCCIYLFRLIDGQLNVSGTTLSQINWCIRQRKRQTECKELEIWNYPVDTLLHLSMCWNLAYFKKLASIKLSETLFCWKKEYCVLEWVHQLFFFFTSY